MPVKIECFICDKELNKIGSILFSPPFDHEQVEGVCDTYHICPVCFGDIMYVFKGWGLIEKQSKLNLIKKKFIGKYDNGMESKYTLPVGIYFDWVKENTDKNEKI